MANWDWVTISALATGLGTLVLALATFASVRSANRAARTAERSLLAGLRPLLFPSRFSDEPLKVSYADQHVFRLPGGHGMAEVTADVIYLAMSLRNVGSGLAVLDGWVVGSGPIGSALRPEHAPLDEFRRLTRDLYVPSSDVFFWQGALRDPTEPDFIEVAEAIRAESPLTVELLYGDEEGGQRTITRYSLLPHHDGEGPLVWLATVSRHWNIDRADPR
ncbi:MAG: hypothetical protein ABJA74_15925 [Lapillicoccus sp.]